jgi:hypothetical protein
MKPRANTIQESFVKIPGDLCAVVIPVHMQNPQPAERISLARCAKVLERYPKILAIPEGLETSSYLEVYPDLETHRFPALHFKSERSYNALLRMASFYERFSDYRYILIYQLDCYVFYDRLEQWCHKGYDYIGAPWTNFDWIKKSNNPLARIPLIKHLLFPVGNGGFSLRKVKSHIKAARRFEFIGKRLDVHEDLYWSSLINRLSPGFRIPSFLEAIDFAIESEPEKCFNINGGRLPFGCHAWELNDRSFWLNHFDPQDKATLQ